HDLVHHGVALLFVHAAEARAERLQSRPEELERGEMRREENYAAALRERGGEVLRAFDPDVAAYRIRIAEPAHGHFDERCAERAEVTPHELAALPCAELGQTRADVAVGDPPPGRDDGVGEHAERFAEREL